MRNAKFEAKIQDERCEMKHLRSFSLIKIRMLAYWSLKKKFEDVLVFEEKCVYIRRKVCDYLKKCVRICILNKFVIVFIFLTFFLFFHFILISFWYIFMRMMKTLIDINVIFVKSSRFVFDLIINVFINIFMFFFSELIIVVFMFRVIVNLIIKYIIFDSNDVINELNLLQQKIIKRQKFEERIKRTINNAFLKIRWLLSNFFSRVLIIIV